MLRKFLRRWLLGDAARTLKAPAAAEVVRPQYVTTETLDAALRKYEDRFEFEMGEWFDKFSTLHARTVKRQQRAAVQPNGPLEEEAGPKRSAIHFRRPGSA